MFSKLSWWLRSCIYFKRNLYVYKYQRKIHWKIYDEYFKDGGDIQLFNLSKKWAIEVWATKTFIEDKINLKGRFKRRISGEIEKKLKLKKSTIFESNLPKSMFFRSCDFVFNFFALFSKMRQSISTLPAILSLLVFCVARTCLVEPHLDAVLEVLLVIG